MKRVHNCFYSQERKTLAFRLLCIVNILIVEECQFRALLIKLSKLLHWQELYMRISWEIMNAGKLWHQRKIIRRN